MNIALCIVSALFGILSLIAALSQAKAERKSLPAALMLTGSIVLIAAVIVHIAKSNLDCLFALVGCAAICAAAILNGQKSGSFHWQHHVVRIALSLVLIVGFFFL